MKYSTVFIATLIMLAMVIPMISFANAVNYNEYTQWGPRMSNFLMKFYANDGLEFTGLENGEIDIVDWPLSRPYYLKWTAAPWNDTIAVVGSSGQFGMRILDVNNNETLPDGTPTFTGDPVIRHAIAHLTDRAQIAAADFQGTAQELYLPVPWACGTSWMDPDTLPPPYGTGLLLHPYSPSEAASILDTAGYTDDGDADTYRNWMGHPGNPNIDILTVYRSDDPYRTAAALRIMNALGLVNVKVTAFPIDSAGAQTKVMTNKDFSLYTGGWSLSVDPPDTCYGLFHSSQYFPPPTWSANYANYGSGTAGAVSDALLTTAWTALVLADAVGPFKQWTRYWMDPAWVPAQTLVSNIIFMAHRKTYSHWTGEEAYWDQPFDGIYNRIGRGIGDYTNFQTFTNVRPESNKAPSTANIRWGWKVPAANTLNPIYGSWTWDWAIMNYVYDSPLAVNPFVTTEFKPWAVYQWNTGLWDNPDNPAYPKSSFITFKFRDDIYAHDGVQYTMDDYKWLVGLDAGDMEPTIVAKALPQPYWYSSIQEIHHTVQPDAQTITVYYNVGSYLALTWLAGLPMCPKHIWKPIFDHAGEPGWPLVNAHLADPTMTGTGPYAFVSYTANAGAVLQAFRGVNGHDYVMSEPIDVKKVTWTYNSKNYVRVTLYNKALEPIDVTYTIDGKTPVLVTVPAAGSVTYPGAYPGQLASDPIEEVTLPVNVAWSYTYYGWAVSKIQDFKANTIREDVNCDGFVNAKDAVPLGVSFNTKPGDAAWDARCDLKYDGFINAKDAVLLGYYFGWPNWKP